MPRIRLAQYFRSLLCASCLCVLTADAQLITGDDPVSNSAPIWDTTPAPNFTAGVASSYNLAALVTDADGDTLAFTNETGCTLPTGVTIDDVNDELDASASTTAGTTSGCVFGVNDGTAPTVNSAAFPIVISAAGGGTTFAEWAMAGIASASGGPTTNGSTQDCDAAGSSDPGLRGPAIIDTSDFNSSPSSLKISPTNSQQDVGCKAPNTTLANDPYTGETVYHRWWMKIGSGFDWGTADQKMKFGRYVLSGGAGQVATFYLYDDRVGFAEASVDPNPNVSIDLDPAGGCTSAGAACTAWREYIIRVTLESNRTADNATFSLYVNGTLIGTSASFSFSDVVTSNDLLLTWVSPGAFAYPQFNTANAGGDIWLDDASTDDTWNSTTYSEP